MRLRARAGFTLVELMIAVLLVDVGLLALVAGSAIVVRRQNELRVRALVARTASNRLQLLASAPCLATSGSATVERGITETWIAVVGPNGIRDLSDSVAYTLNGMARGAVLRTRTSC